MKAPKIQSIGKKIPKKNIHPRPFLSVISPSVKTKTKYRMPAPIPIPHQMISSWTRLDVDSRLDSDARNEAVHHPMRTMVEKGRTHRAVGA